MVLCIWPPSSTGSAGACSAIACGSQWRLTSVEALQEALTKHGSPQILNTDQASQFTSFDFTDVLIRNTVAISMDGKGAWRDNVFVERIWKSVKYEEVYLRAYDSVSEARASIGRYLDFYNHDARTPALTGERPMRPTSIIRR